MRNKFIMAAVFSIFLLISPNVKAASFTDNQTVDANKTWTIKFTDDVGLDDVTKQGITVTDSTGAAISVGIQLGEDSKTVTVTAPEGGYTAGESYTLDVGTKAHSSKGKALKSEYKVNFTISEIVTFKDANLEQAIRDKIDKPTGNIYKSNVEKITELDVQQRQIQDISGIENLVNLQMLNLFANQISNIDVLKNLSNLKQLYLSGNNISDISVLKNLTNLQMLNLSKYYYDKSQINDISPLKNLTNLKQLYLSGYQLKDINVLKGLVNLESIDLSYNEISDISPLKNLTNLKQLYLGYNKITDISALSDLTNLQELNLGYVPFGGIPDPVLEVNYNEISDISALKNLNNLQTLNLGYNQINNISDMSALKDLTNLQTLDLYNNKISDINPLISALKELPNLKSLDLSSNQISDISALENLINLQSLHLNCNKINDISALKGLFKLQSLELQGNQISDISILLRLPKLIENNQIDINTVLGFSLRSLNLLGNQISDDDIQSLKNALPWCRINEIICKKPNIYLYPEKTEDLSVYVTPNGKITKSIPEYNEGWKVTVYPSGKIDNTYDFLFYEASLNYQFTLNKGWIVNKDIFNEEMNNILTSIGLNSKEKADFIEYWSKELNWKTNRYAAYYLDPKEIDEAIKLNISKEPDSLLRAFFYFVPLNDNENLEIKKPEIQEFKRSGFTVVEWGGIGK